MGRNTVWLRPDRQRIVSGLLFPILLVLAWLGGAVSAYADKPFPYVYVPELSASYNADLAIIDTGTNAVVTRVSLGTFPQSPNPIAGAATPDGSTVYLVNSNDSVSVINVPTGAITSSISIGGPINLTSPLGIAVTPDGADVYVTNGFGDLVDIATSTNTVAKTVPLNTTQSRGAGVAISPDGSKIYVSLPSTSSVAVVDRNGTTVDTTIPVGTSPAALAVTPDGRKLYVESATTVSVIATNTNTVTKTIVTPGPAFPYGGAVAASPDGSKIYAGVGTTPTNYVISVIATASDSIVDSILAGPGTIALTPDGAHIYVATSGRLLYVDSASEKTVSSITSVAPAASYASPTIFAGGFRSNSTLQINTTGTGTGTVTSGPPGIACGGACSHSFGTGSVVTLTATAAAGSTFTGWSGACSGTSDCTLALSNDTTVAASFAAAPAVTNALTISAMGSGSGTVRSAPSGLSCGSICTASYATGSTVTLTASATPGFAFMGWGGGACSGTDPCTVTLNADTAVTADFEPVVPPVALTVSIGGVGAIVSVPAAINCSFLPQSNCQQTFSPGTIVTLFAESGPFGAAFAGWTGGGCSGTAPCTITLNSDVAVTANFTNTPNAVGLTVANAGSGSGTISSNPSGVYCSAAGTCGVSDFASGTTVTLTPTPNPGSTFTGWSGGVCTGTGPCTLVLNTNATVTGTFAFTASDATLSVSQSGSGSGTITSNPSGINCGSSCSDSVPTGQTVVLTATPNAGSTFTGWSGGGCFGSGTCTIAMNESESVVANFSAPLFNDTVSVTLAGSIGGTVTSTPAGINCGSSCSAAFADGTSVQLHLTPASGSVASLTANPSGGAFCSDPNNCILNLAGDVSVTATFNPAATLTVVVNNSLGGSVFSNPLGISCSGTCSAQFGTGSQVTLTAAPGLGTFLGWSGGGCSGTGSCTVTMTGALTVTANFSIPQSTVSVSLKGSGGGTVSSSPAGISCGQTCSASFLNVLPLTLTATPATGSFFVGWSGGPCIGIMSCQLFPTSNTSVTATFDRIGGPYTYPTLSISVVGQGFVTPTINTNPPIVPVTQCATCQVQVLNGTTVSLAADPSGGWVFTGWSNACTGIVCSLAVTTNESVVANFAPAVTMSVSKSGTGTGLITTNPSGVTCGSTCSSQFAMGSQINLTAAASQGSRFTGWSGGGCSGTGACVVTPMAATSVVADFELLPTTAMLSVTKTGTGTGTVASSPSGIACGGTCNASFSIGAPVTLTATADAGSTFVGWSGGGCGGNQTCVVSPAEDTTVTADFVADASTTIAMASAILPSSRSVEVGSVATIFGTLINAGPGTATYCTVAPATSVPVGFAFQTTDPASNALTGTPNTPIDIPQGTAQTFVLVFTPSQAFDPTNISLNFSCSNANAAPTYSGVNTLLLSASMTPVPDIVAISGTLSSDGTLHIAGPSAAAAFVVAISNVGSTAQMTAVPDTGGANLPLTLTVCQTNPETGACLAPDAPSASSQVGGQTTASYGIFAKATGTVPFLPAANRIFVRFVDAGGVTRGSTSVAVTTAQ